MSLSSIMQPVLLHFAYSLQAYWLNPMTVAISSKPGKSATMRAPAAAISGPRLSTSLMLSARSVTTEPMSCIVAPYSASSWSLSGNPDSLARK